MRPTRLALAFAGVGLVLLALPDARSRLDSGHPHLSRRDRSSPTCTLLPARRGRPAPRLSRSISSTATSPPTPPSRSTTLPLGRHCHYWHVGQEIHDLADVGRAPRLRARAISAISPPTPSPTTTSCPASSCSPAARPRSGTRTGRRGSRATWAMPTPKSAKDVILLDHAEADAHLDRIISPTIFSVRTNRRLFRGMVHLTESSSWQRATQVAREYSRWHLDRRRRRAPSRPVLRLHGRAARRRRHRPRTSSIPRASGRSRWPRSSGAGCSGTAGAATRPGSRPRPRSTSACPSDRSRSGLASRRGFRGARRRARHPRRAPS